MKMPKQLLLISLLIYVISALGSYSAFSFIDRSETSTNDGLSQDELDSETALGLLLDLDPSAPKDQVCPTSGKMYTLTERNSWEGRRPLAVMIENSPDSRPQSGLSHADIIFEAVAEGGVTRFMGIFYCDAQAYDVTLAPIRSARTYFLDYASGFNFPLYTHVGGANLPGPTDALGQIAEYGWVGENNLNQFSIGFPTFIRDYNRVPGKTIATEHTMVTTTEKLWAIAEERGWTNTPPTRLQNSKTIPQGNWWDNYESWTFADELSASGAITKISYEFWTGLTEYFVEWQFDPATKSYLRFMANEPHLDLNSEDQISAANVVVLKTNERGPLNEVKHMMYDTIGTGEALIFSNGNVVEGTWSKPSRTAELEFLNEKGKSVEMARGLTWISIVDKSNDVAY
jgi:hypothetical protein